MDALNAILFPLLNAPAAPNPSILALARFAADWLLYAVFCGVALLWVVGGGDVRTRLLRSVSVASIGLMANFVISALWYHPRPFELGVGHQFVAHLPETSFPSDHATLLFSLAFGMMRAGLSRGIAVSTLVAAALVAWGRVYVGVHWPMDMVGSIVVAAFAARVFGWLDALPAVARLWDRLLRVNDAVLNGLRVPEWLSPRSELR